MDYINVFSWPPGVMFVLGTLVGSFLNVCIYRIPAGKSVVAPPSSCGNCGKRIPWYLNIPILGYLFCGGKCFNCKVKLSLQYPVIELVTGLWFYVVAITWGHPLVVAYYALFGTLLLTVSMIDLHHKIIPNVVSLPGVVVGLVGSVLWAWPSSFYDSLFGVLLGGGSLFAVAWLFHLLTGKEGMGMGDVKLLAMIGAFMGWQPIFPIVMISSMLGIVVGAPYTMLQKNRDNKTIPFGPFLSGAAAIYLFWGEEILTWYFSLL